MCQCIIICNCVILDIPPETLNPTGPIRGVECLLGKTLPPLSVAQRADPQIFDIKNHFKTYAYTLSPKNVGIMQQKTKDNQYKTLKRLHNEILSQFKCSYIINIEEYPSDTSNLHCHGMIRFINHNQKEKFKKMMKERITMMKKGNYPNLIDCEFINDFKAWTDYIDKDQPHIINQGYHPFVKIDHSFHIEHLEAIQKINVNPVSKTIKSPTAREKAELRLQKLELQILSLKKSLEIL